MASTTAASNDDASASTQTFKFAAIQMRCTADKLANLEHAFQLIKEASSKGAQLIALPVRKHLFIKVVFRPIFPPFALTGDDNRLLKSKTDPTFYFLSSYLWYRLGVLQ